MGIGTIHGFRPPVTSRSTAWLARRSVSCRCQSSDRSGSPQASYGQAEPPSAHALRLRLQKAAAVLVAAGLGTALGLGLLPMWVPATRAVTTEQLLFLEAWRAVDRAYVDKAFNGQSWFRLRERYLKSEPMETREQTYAAVQKLLATLDDPFTRFLEPARYAALRRGTAGAAVVGVGLEVGFGRSPGGPQSELVVITPTPGGPAERAGVGPADALEAIDGRPTAGLSLYEAGDLLQGAEGSQLLRDRGGAPGAGSANGGGGAGLGYIRVRSFSQATGAGVQDAIRSLQRDGARRYVLDIRNNGGGLFPASVEVARMWVPNGDLVLIADANGVRDAYEVLAGALQDNGRAQIVGERTFGKGLIQTIVELSDGSGLAVTVARYQTPSGRDINKVGIAPDVPLAPDAFPPQDGPSFCAFMASARAPSLFG